jgi:UDP-N-acetylglucosamine--N-acetylmuramyl-(pentapeptide) pyrophosphoryl-undecaprenol N-acetylglucosamine transferase
LTAFPEVFAGAEVVGNPVRSDIAQLPEPEQRLAERANPDSFRLLVLGGSLGAQALNELVPQGLAKLSQAQRPQVRHQSGRNRAAACQELYRELEVEAQVDEFIDDMAEAYGWADLVICRAGALTVSELMAVGVAALLVPYPHAIDDHQRRNAEVLEKAGAARVVAQKDLDAERLAALLTSELASAEQRLDMARKGRRLAQPEAAEKVAQHCLEVARG